MTREEAIYIIDHLKPTDVKDSFDAYIVGETLNMAINALEQETLEIEAAKLQKAYNKGFEDCIQAVKYVNMYIKGGKDNDLYSVK